MGRDLVSTPYHRLQIVSIHAPRMGRDGMTVNPTPEQCRFQFTRPAWGATKN